MANTYVLIETITVGSGGAASVTFSSIPQTYTDLVLRVSARTVRAAGVSDSVLVSFNNSTTTYSGRILFGDGSSAGSQTYTSTGGVSAVSNTATANIFSNTEMYIPNYTGSTNKSFSGDNVTENNGTQSYPILDSGLWSTTSAITSLVCSGGNGNLMQYTTLSLYGIKNS
jgi:hypothetical protein